MQGQNAQIPNVATAVNNVSGAPPGGGPSLNPGAIPTQMKPQIPNAEVKQYAGQLPKHPAPDTDLKLPLETVDNQPVPVTFGERRDTNVDGYLWGFPEPAGAHTDSHTYPYKPTQYETRKNDVEKSGGTTSIPQPSYGQVSQDNLIVQKCGYGYNERDLRRMELFGFAPYKRPDAYNPS